MTFYTIPIIYSTAGRMIVRIHFSFVAIWLKKFNQNDQIESVADNLKPYIVNRDYFNKHSNMSCHWLSHRLYQSRNTRLYCLNITCFFLTHDIFGWQYRIVCLFDHTYTKGAWEHTQTSIQSIWSNKMEENKEKWEEMKNKHTLCYI